MRPRPSLQGLFLCHDLSDENRLPIDRGIQEAKIMALGFDLWWPLLLDRSDEKLSGGHLRIVIFWIMCAKD